ncbi:MAG: hypothetical protein R3F56_12660 [Planctomycetota bacterium]
MRVLLVLTFSLSLAAQQQCDARNDDGTLVTNVTTGGPNLSIGMRLVAQSSFTIDAAQVQTGLQTGGGSFAIWSHDAVNDRPASNISGDGTYTQTRIVCWQGAALPTPVTVTTGQVFWVVWSMPNGSRTPWSTNPVGDVPYRGSFDGGLTWNGQNNGAQPWPAKPYKIRLFCPYPTTPFQHVGQGKAGTVGVPVIDTTGWAALRNEVDVNLESAAPASPAVLGIGTPTQIQIPGLADVYVNPVVTVLVTTSGTAGRGAGDASVPLVIPRAGARGFPLALQWFVLDAQALNGLAHTDGSQTIVN